MTIDLSIAWAILSALFLGTGMYYQFVYKGRVSNWATGAFVMLGLVLFIALNRRIRIEDEIWLAVTEVMLIVGLFLTWALGTVALHLAVRDDVDVEVAT